MWLIVGMELNLTGVTNNAIHISGFTDNDGDIVKVKQYEQRGWFLSQQIMESSHLFPQ
jgi:hypothetical protein